MAQEKNNQATIILKSKIEELEKTYGRGLLKESFECSARCASRSDLTADELNRCVDACNITYRNVSNFITSEFMNFQGRFSRCFSNCYEDLKDNLVENPTAAQVKEMEQFYDRCASRCIDKHIGQLPTFMQKMHQTLRARSQKAQIKDELKFEVHNV